MRNLSLRLVRSVLPEHAGWCICYPKQRDSVADPEGGRGGAALSKIDQNLAKLAPFVPILASTPPELTTLDPPL